MTVCGVKISQLKVLDMDMMIECLIVTKGELTIELWVSELGVLYGRSKKEAAN